MQEVSKKTEFVEKLRRSKNSNSLKGERRGAAIGSLREASQVGKRVNEPGREKLLHFAGLAKEDLVDEIV